MPSIAVAGGTSPTLGTAIVNALRASGVGHSIVILSSRPTLDPHPSADVSIRTVDYADVANLYYALSDVDILISVLKIPGPEWATYQINLLQAAVTAGVKRFAPSEFEVGPVADGAVDVLAGKLAVWDACRAAMDKGEIVCARFACGMFMNYLGLGSDRDTDATHGLDDTPVIWDVQNMTAELPITNREGRDERDGVFGPGVTLTLTEIGDVGRFVVAACELSTWPTDGDLGMIGETISTDEVIRAIERVRGRSMAAVTGVGQNEFAERVARIDGIGRDREEIRAKMVAQMMVAACEGKAVTNGRLNELCSSVQPVGVEEYLKRTWGPV